MKKERKLIIAGNWKMNKTVAEALALVRGLKIELANVKEVDIVDLSAVHGAGRGFAGHHRHRHPPGRAKHERE